MKQLRRTMLYVPGNNPGMIRDAYIYGSDSIMFDLEDSVSVDQKDSARFLVYEALHTIDYGNKELVVRTIAKWSSACRRRKRRTMFWNVKSRSNALSGKTGSPPGPPA